MYDKIASGGMASVHLGRLFGAVGFSRTVAIKHLHPHYSSDPEFISMFLDEVRLVSRIQHPNVAAPLDVVLEDNSELFLIMEYIHGETLGCLVGSARSAGLMIPLSVSASIITGALHGLHAAHEAVDEAGRPLNIVHRDMSPQNVMVGVDGVARVLDFGVAKAVSRCQSTRDGHLKGKLSYMAPEQMRSGPVDRRVDIFTAGIVLWEVLTQRRLFKPDDPAAAFSMILNAPIQRPSTVNREVPPSLDNVVMRALDRDPDRRFQTALEFADGIEDAIPLASHRKVGEWVQRLCSQKLSERADKVSSIERLAFDPDSSKDAQELLRSKRGSVPADAADPTGSSPDQAITSGARMRAHQSTVTSAEIPPSPSPDVPPTHVPTVRKAWLLIAALSVLALVLGIGNLFRLPWGSLGAKRRTVTEHPISAPPSRAPRPSQTPRPGQVPEPSLAPQPPSSVVEQSPGVAPSRQASVDENSAATAPAPPGKSELRRVDAMPVRHRAKAKSGPTRVAKTNKPSGKSNCDPPYYIDDRGIRRVKPQCL